jgi:hypothetical protein
MTLIDLARTELPLGRLPDAFSYSQRALALAESFVEKDQPSYLVGLARLAEADIRRARGETETADAAYRSALQHLGSTLGADHPATVAARQGPTPPASP